MGVIEKSSALSGVSIKALTKLKNYINMIHSDDIYLDMNDGKSVFEIDTFEGTILIKYENNEIKYKNKYYFHLHNHPERYAHCEKLAAKSAKIIGVSEFISKAFAKKIGIPFTNDKFAILHNYIDSNIFDIGIAHEKNQDFYHLFFH